MANLVVPESNYTVISGGGKFRIQADVQGARNANEKKLIWGEPNGCIDNGVFTIPTVVTPTTYIVTVSMLEDSAQTQQITVTVNPKPILKKIGSLKVWQHGTSLTSQVLDIEGIGFKTKLKLTEHYPVVSGVLPAFTPAPDFDTDDKGCLTITLDQSALAQNVDRSIHVQAMGSDKEETIFLRKIRKEKCPRCQSPLWDGNKCPTCNYPKSRKSR